MSRVNRPVPPESDGAVPDGAGGGRPDDLLSEPSTTSSMFVCPTDAQYVFASLSRELGAVLHNRNEAASPDFDADGPTDSARSSAMRKSSADVSIEGLWAQTLESVIQAEQLTAELADAQAELAQLRVAVASNRDIGVAVGIVMSQERVTREGAFARLRGVSQARHLKLREVAYGVIEAGCLDEARGQAGHVGRPVPTLPLARRAEQEKKSRRAS